MSLRVVVLMTLLVGGLLAQLPDELGPVGSAELTPDSGAQRIALRVDSPPEEGDQFSVTLSSGRLGVTLVAPSGSRVTEANARESGYSWHESEPSLEFGSMEGWRSVSIEFLEAGEPGEYVIEVTTNDLDGPAQAGVRFVSERRRMSAALEELPGFRQSGPTVFDATPATVSVDLERDDPAGIFEFVVSDPAAQLSLTLPDGRTIGPDSVDDGLSWRTFADGEPQATPAAMFFAVPEYWLPQNGTHHVVTIENAPRGRYEVRVEEFETDSIELTAAVIPLGRAFEEEEEQRRTGWAPPGEVALQLYGPEGGNYVGEEIRLLLRMGGEPVAEPVEFAVRLEYREIVRTEPELEFGPPVVEEAPANLAPTPEGRYRGTVVPTRTGMLRIQVRATGRTASGQPFSVEDVVDGPQVQRVVARLASLTERAVDADGNGRPDRLDITAHLDIELAGEYEMQLMLTPPEQRIGPSPDVPRQELATGRQTLTASIPASELRRRLGDGPWTIRHVLIYRPVAGTFGDIVPMAREFTLTTAPYRLDEWE